MAWRRACFSIICFVKHFALSFLPQPILFMMNSRAPTKPGLDRASLFDKNIVSDYIRLISFYWNSTKSHSINNFLSYWSFSSSSVSWRIIACLFSSLVWLVWAYVLSFVVFVSIVLKRTRSCLGSFAFSEALRSKVGIGSLRMLSLAGLSLDTLLSSLISLKCRLRAQSDSLMLQFVLGWAFGSW